MPVSEVHITALYRASCSIVATHFAKTSDPRQAQSLSIRLTQINLGTIMMIVPYRTTIMKMPVCLSLHSGLIGFSTHCQHRLHAAGPNALQILTAFPWQSMIIQALPYCLGNCLGSEGNHNQASELRRSLLGIDFARVRKKQRIRPAK